MKRLIAISLTTTVLFSFCCYSNLWAREKRKVNGYTVAIDWQANSKRLRCWGMITGGKKCNKLKVKVELHNEYGGNAYIKDTVKYTKLSGTKFKDKDDIFTTHRFKRKHDDWYITDLRIVCDD